MPRDILHYRHDQARSEACRHTMTHDGHEGSIHASRIRAREHRVTGCGEDVPVHKANLLGNFSRIGVGDAVAEDGISSRCVTFGLPPRRE